MKKNLKISFCLLFVLFSLMACQDEENKTTIEEDQALSKSAPLTGLLKRVATADMSSDNIIDSTSCFKVKLPVDVIVNGQPLHIDSEEDFAAVQQIIDVTDPNEVSVDLVFPITVVFADGQQSIIQNQEIMDAIVSDCEFGYPNEEPINCISINYPITIFGYNANFQLASTHIIQSNQQLFALLGNLQNNQFYSIDFPISFTNVNGQIITAHNNSELQDAITQNSCTPVDPCANPNILTDGLIIYMPFANEVKDLKGGQVMVDGSVYFTTDRNGNEKAALGYNANDPGREIKIIATEFNNIEPEDSLSISIWFKLKNIDLGNREYLFGKFGGFANGFYMEGFYAQVYDGNSPNFTAPNVNDVWDTSWQSDNLQQDTENWHHLVITSSRIPNTNKHTVKLYRDGLLRNSKVFESLYINTQVINYYVGKDFEGYLDDLRVYRKTLSLQQVQQLYNLEGDQNTCLN